MCSQNDSDIEELMGKGGPNDGGGSQNSEDGDMEVESVEGIMGRGGPNDDAHSPSADSEDLLDDLSGKSEKKADLVVIEEDDEEFDSETLEDLLDDLDEKSDKRESKKLKKQAEEEEEDGGDCEIAELLAEMDPEQGRWPKICDSSDDDVEYVPLPKKKKKRKKKKKKLKIANFEEDIEQMDIGSHPSCPDPEDVLDLFDSEDECEDFLTDHVVDGEEEGEEDLTMEILVNEWLEDEEEPKSKKKKQWWRKKPWAQTLSEFVVSRMLTILVDVTHLEVPTRSV